MQTKLTYATQDTDERPFFQFQNKWRIKHQTEFEILIALLNHFEVSIQLKPKFKSKATWKREQFMYFSSNFGKKFVKCKFVCTKMI